jgi:BirA family biotin operon repressor/biotin-[acetyl-CoA-carboxylase] ligase
MKAIMDVDTLTSLLAGSPVAQIRYFDTIGSTNDEALAWAAAGAEDGCLVVADQQTRGRGRMNRRWITRPGVALAFSIILRPRPEEIDHLGFFSPLGALAISQALEQTLGLSPQIKWPNDVLLEERKVAGILLESTWMGTRPQGTVIGMGINVAPEAVPPPEELLFPATSVEEAAGRPVDRFGLLRAILEATFEWRSKLADPAFRQAWEQRLAFRGQWVRIEEAGSASPVSGPPLSGQVLGIHADGSLLLRGAAGETIPVKVGDVHLRRVEL